MNDTIKVKLRRRKWESTGRHKDKTEYHQSQYDTGRDSVVKHAFSTYSRCKKKSGEKENERPKRRSWN